ncbi:hypothetical protein ACFWP7_30250 [Streptomyces sp. NPDC058470]|uniref:hypothetical protein n=1 Tax=Streptomyces sp. NPDC058470 TaxID=3346515 RepID=UPI00364CC457
MTVTVSHETDRNTARKRRLRRTGSMAVLLTAVALAAGACGGEEKDAKASATSSQSSETSQMLAYAECMRTNGVADFPDPQAGGGLTLPEGIDPKSDSFKKADDKCKTYAPNRGGSGDGDNAPTQEQLDYAKCMRENGVPKFPDPQSNQGLLEQGSGIDVESSEYKKASEACQQYLPGDLQGGPQ